MNTPAVPSTGVSDLPDWCGWLFQVLILLNLTLTFWLAIRFPIEGDGRLYHAPRAMYWIQNRSILPVDSATTQMMALPYGTDLVFASAMTLTGSDIAGKLAMWLAIPLLAATTFAVLIMLGTPKNLRWGLIALASIIGLFPGLLLSLQPEIYQAAWVMGCVWAWLKSRDCISERRPAWLALSTALGVWAVSAKPTAVPVLFLVIHETFRHRPMLWKSLTFVALAGVISAIASGLVFTACYTWKWFGQPFSIGPMAPEIYREPSLERFAIHLFRFLVSLLNPLTPEVGRYLGIPALTDLADSIEHSFRAMADSLQLHREFPQELPHVWPGPYRYIAQGGAGNAGLLNIFGLSAAIWSILHFRRKSAPTHSLVSLISIVCILSQLYLLRWQPGVPRFVFFAAALWIVPLSIAAARSRQLAWVVAVLAVFQAAAVIIGTISFYRNYRIDGDPAIAIFSLRPVGAVLPAGAKVLFVGSSTTYEYDIWGNSRKIFPWGRRPYSKSDLDGQIRQTGADHILIDDCARFPGMQHACPWGFDDFERDLDSRADWERIPVNVPKTPVTDQPENFLVLYRRVFRP